MRYIDEVFINAANTIRRPGYSLVDGLVEYDVNTHLTLRLNVYNLTDEIYIRNVNNNGGRYNPGTPRSAIADVERPVLEDAMLLTIPDVLTAEQVSTRARAARQRPSGSTARSRPARSRRAPRTTCSCPRDPPSPSELGDMILTALQRNALFISAALPLRVFPPLFNRYQGGQAFGNHVDNAIRQVAGTGHRIRTDLSATLFLAEPDEYDGGELIGRRHLRRAQGEAAGGPHGAVSRRPACTRAPVTRGARVASFFWIQSMVRDDGQRTLLFDLDAAIQRSRATCRRIRRRCSSPASTTTCFAAGRRCEALMKTAIRVVLAAPRLRRRRRRRHLHHVGHRGAADLSAADHGVGRHARVSSEPSRRDSAFRRRAPREGRERTARSVADGDGGSIGARRAGIAGGWRGASALRQSLHGRGAGRRQRTGDARLLPRRRRVASLRGGVRRQPPPGTGDHRRVESRCSSSSSSAACSSGGRARGRRRRCATSSGSSGGLAGKARDFNWHNTIGFWSAIPLAIIVAGGVVISYPWATALVYRAYGEAPPAPAGGLGARGGGPGARSRRGTA